MWFKEIIFLLFFLGQNALTLATFYGDIKLICELLRYCSYKEFNKTTLTPALCVAALRKNWTLVTFFKELDRHQSYYIQTAHGKCDTVIENGEISRNCEYILNVACVT